MKPILPLARDLGEKLGGDPWCKPIAKLEPIPMPVRPTQGRWPDDVWAQMERIYSGEDLR